MKKKSSILLISIIILASIIRIWRLADIPSGLHGDEAAFGYNAYSILLTGKDEYGKFLPIILKSFGDYAGAVYAYITIPFVKIFGLNEFAVRLPTALFGIVFVYIGYLITEYLTKNKTIGILTAALLAISPISILLSRVQSDPLVSIVFVLIGLYLFFHWIQSWKKVFLVGYAIFFILSLYTYFSPRIFVPFLLGLLAVFYGKEILHAKKHYLFIAVCILVLLFDGLLFIGNAKQRLNQLYIFNHPAVILPMQEYIREEGPNNALFARVVHNKLTAHVDFILKNYFSYFNYDFLFAKGGMPDRERIPNAGLMYPIELPFLVIGLYFAVTNKKRWLGFLLSWIFITPFFLAFAMDESPNVHRFFFVMLPMELLVAYGLYESFQYINKRLPKVSLLFASGVFGIFLYSLLCFYDSLFNLQPVHMPWYRGYVYKDLVSSVQQIEGNYKKVVISKTLGAPYIYFLFYEKYDPSLYQKEGSPRDLDYTGFGKYFFEPEDCPLEPRKTNNGKVYPIEQHVLYVNKWDCSTTLANIKVIKTIYWKDGNPAVKLVEYNGNDPMKDLLPISTQSQN